MLNRSATKHFKSTFYEYEDTKILLEEFVHRLGIEDEHLFEAISKGIHPCNSVECTRSETNEEVEASGPMDSALNQIVDLDKIYCYCVHNRGMRDRISSDQKENLKCAIHFINNNETSPRVLYADMMVLNQTILQKQSQQLKSARHQRFTQFVNLNYEKFDNGFAMKYNDRYGSSAISVKPLYHSIKQELIQNSMCRLNIRQFNVEYCKSMIHFNTKYRKKIYSTMQIQHILSLLFYCNYTQLSYQFSRTYRKGYIHKHREYYYFGLYLLQAVQDFGEKNTNVFYHGISKKLAFDTILKGDCLNNGFAFNACFPLSTTSSFEVAANFAQQGLIMEIKALHQARSFSVDWLSDFPYEKERIFLNMDPRVFSMNDTRLRITNLWNISDSEELQPIIDLFHIDMESKAAAPFRCCEEMIFSKKTLQVLKDIYNQDFDGYSDYAKHLMLSITNHLTKIHIILMSLTSRLSINVLIKMEKKQLHSFLF